MPGRTTSQSRYEITVFSLYYIEFDRAFLAIGYPCLQGRKSDKGVFSHKPVWQSTRLRRRRLCAYRKRCHNQLFTEKAELRRKAGSFAFRAATPRQIRTVAPVYCRTPRSHIGACFKSRSSYSQRKPGQYVALWWVVFLCGICFALPPLPPFRISPCHVNPFCCDQLMFMFLQKSCLRTNGESSKKFACRQLIELFQNMVLVSSMVIHLAQLILL